MAIVMANCAAKVSSVEEFQPIVPLLEKWGKSKFVHRARREKGHSGTGFRRI